MADGDIQYKKTRGWKYTGAEVGGSTVPARLEAWVNGLEGARLTPSTTGVDVRLLGDTPGTNYIDFDASGPTLTLAGVTLSFSGAGDVNLPSASVDKADLATEVYTIEHIMLTGNTNDFDNETIKISRLWSAGTVVRVVYFTNAALGTSLGIDILDGGTDGTGTDVIDSCSDNLSGLDSNNLSTPYALSANDYVCIKLDDVTNDVSFTIDIQVKVPAGAAT